MQEPPENGMENMEQEVVVPEESGMEMKEQLTYITELITKQLQTKDALIDRLHEELAYYKKDAANKFENQLLKAVIKIRHDMKRNLAGEQMKQMSPEELLEQYVYIFEDLTDLLEQQNCDEIVSEPGTAFDPAIHQPKLEQTEDAQLDKMVKCSLSEGYRKSEKVLIPERVIVYQHKA